MTSSSDPQRIGGEFELRPRDLDVGSATVAPLPTFGAAHELWLDSGRSALTLVARELQRAGMRPIVWLPAYCCESVAAPFRRCMLDVRFYAVGAGLDRVDADPSPGDVLLFVHYFGRRNQTALQRVQTWRDRSVLVVEDCVQAALTSGVGRNADHALTSLRKLLPQPDGALLASRHPLDARIDPADEAFISARTTGKLLRGAGAASASFLPLFEQSEQRLDDGRVRAMSWLSRRLLGMTDLRQAAARRVTNFARLSRELRRLGSTCQARPLWDTLEDGEVPLGCPVIVDTAHRDALRRHLAQHDIFCPIHWDLSHVTGGGFDAEHALSKSMLTLPIDQRYDEDDMTRILQALSTYFGDRP